MMNPNRHGACTLALKGVHAVFKYLERGFLIIFRCL